MNSRTYQLSAAPDATNRDDETNFARALVRPLQAEVLLDAVGAGGRRPAALRRLSRPARGPVQLPGVVARSGGAAARQRRARQFLAVFGKPVRSLSCECERGDDTTLAQAFQLITGAAAQRACWPTPDNRLGKLLAAEGADDEILEELYLAALCRRPTKAERAGGAGG